ncbi:MAG: hypothetical protein HYV29_10655 [Ignavibacteriales bacterium]|nr:hypothetical protein [Ignavibacteriales bacterium]
MKSFIENQLFDVEQKSTKTMCDNFDIVIAEGEFKYKGKYTFFAKLVSLDDENKGEILHQLSKHFWVEENPPQKGIFEDIDKFSFPKEEQSLMGYSSRSESGSYIFHYNIDHPAKKSVEIDEDMFMKYLIELMSFELVWIDLRSSEHDSKLFTKEDREYPDKLIRKIINFYGQIKFNLN